jgi:ribosomal protein L37E
VPNGAAVSYRRDKLNIFDWLKSFGEPRREPRHMRKPALYRCACGERPGVNRTNDGEAHIYYVSCKRCGERTFAKRTYQEAVGAWNRGERFGR